jgi:hypothetical protein
LGAGAWEIAGFGAGIVDLGADVVGFDDRGII